MWCVGVLVSVSASETVCVCVCVCMCVCVCVCEHAAPPSPSCKSCMLCNTLQLAAATQHVLSSRHLCALLYIAICVRCCIVGCSVLQCVAVCCMPYVQEL